MVNPSPSQNTFSSSLQQQTLKNASPKSYQEIALDPNKSTFSSCLQEQDMVNPDTHCAYPTKNYFPSNLKMMNPYPTKTTRAAELFFCPIPRSLPLICPT